MTDKPQGYAHLTAKIDELKRELAAEKEWVRQLTNSNARLKKFLVEAQAEIVRLTQKTMHPEIKKMYEDYFDKCFRESSAQQRQWIGLTEDEMNQCSYAEGFMIDREVAMRAVQAKLKEKNK